MLELEKLYINYHNQSMDGPLKKTYMCCRAIENEELSQNLKKKLSQNEL